MRKGIKWEGMLLRADPENIAAMDTYANLLYKTGKRRQALNWELKAARLDPGNKDIAMNYDKMKKGDPTWTQ